MSVSIDSPRLKMHDGWAGRRGAVLLLVLAVLLILALIGTVFLTFQGVERLVSRSYSDEVRARLLAESGMEHAMSELRVLMLQPWDTASVPATVEGLILRYDQIGAVHRSLNAQYRWTYYGDAPNITAPPNPNVILEDATHPSFARRDVAGVPLPVSMDGVNRGISGSMAYGTYAVNGDVYALRVTEESGCINVNDGVDWGNTHSVSMNAARILNELGRTVTPASTNVGTTLINNRPTIGYASKLQVRDVMLSNGFTDAQYRSLAPHITVNSWRDSAVANPVPLSSNATVLAAYPVTYARPSSGGIKYYRYGHDRDYVGNSLTSPLLWYGAGAGNWHNAVYDAQALHPMWIEVVARSPVNVNTASHEVLVSLLGDLRGFFCSIEPRRTRPLTGSATSSNYRWLVHHQNLTSTGNYPNSVVPGVVSEGPPPADSDGDQSGLIYNTMRYWNEKAGAVPADGLSAQVIAQEMIACRMRVSCATIHTNYATTPPAGHPTTDYSTAGPFCGPFRNWAQFNAFCDFLVAAGVIQERRVGGAYSTWFQDYFQTGTLKNEASSSWIQRRMAAEAAADVLKANFNPNLHLNELNPDRAVYTHVDKTDLIVNSTEFCFLPMNGAFEIESLGRVLRPVGAAGADVLGTGVPTNVVAEKKLVASVSLWSAIRETSQAQFYTGTMGTRSGGYMTNYGYAVESGPEPDNGPITTLGFDQMTRWDGWVQLSTLGGNLHGSGAASPKPKNVYYVTDNNVYSGMTSTGFAADVGASIHAHFSWDAMSHYNRAAAALSPAYVCNLPVGPWSISTGYVGGGPFFTRNGPLIGMSMGVAVYEWDGVEWDEGGVTPHRNHTAAGAEGTATAEAYAGPYTPPHHIYTSPASPHRFRLGRSFTLSSGGTYSFSPLTFTPSDLRLDGMYIQRRASFGWFLWDEQCNNQPGNNPDPPATLSTAWTAQSNFHVMQGAASFWFKPNWFPECTGRIRTLLSMTRFRDHHAIREGPAGSFWLHGGYDHNHPTTNHGAPGGTCNGACVTNPWATSSQRECNNAGSVSTSSSTYTPYLQGWQPFTLYFFPAGSHNSGTTSGGMSAYDYYATGYLPSYTSAIERIVPLSLGWGFGTGRPQGGNWDVQVPARGFGNWWCDNGYTSSYIIPNHPSTHNPGGVRQNRHGTWGNYHNHVLTPTLNHEDHATGLKPGPLLGRDGAFNHIRGHEWVHIAVTWDLPYMSEGYGSTTDFQILVNGQQINPGTAAFTHSSNNYNTDGYADMSMAFRSIPWWNLSPSFWNVSGATKYAMTCVTLGGETDWPSNAYAQSMDSTIRNNMSISAGGIQPRNYYADGTFDEFYFWTDDNTGPGQGLYEAQQQALRGRYYRPADSTLTDGIFTSQLLSIPQPNDLMRALPPASGTALPPTGTTATSAPPAAQSRVIGIAWTAYAEGYNYERGALTPASHWSSGAPSATENTAAMAPYIRDWNNTGPSNPRAMPLTTTPDANGFRARSVVDMYVSTNGGGTWPLGPYRNDHFSPVLTNGGPTPAVNVMYRAKLMTGSASASTSLLSSPILDDVTVFYDLGGPRVLSLMWIPFR